ncbi:LytR/AlgR family response regulator transcription factor [Luteibacter yeojuensis]|uniref:Histidine kinase n=1 Tax=Luteibacter yeojuensis TaxID=345309 RepID=A0A0F3KQW1_9GAMM|nr:LytTR family DNA-binding domain-containing protein [Luteibacter yeojuensis]KJV32509.1 histidine kinase [Luteibacter yeojuensis]
MPIERRRMRVLIADDEAPARLRLREILEADAGVGTILEATNGIEAVEAIERESPDVVFLDIQMPGMDGLAVVRAIGAARMPATIFVTAFDAHAVQAFEDAAIDYVLKPCSDERIRTALQRATTRAEGAALLAFGGALAAFMGTPAAPPGLPDRLLVKDRGAMELVSVTSIDCIESAGTYVVLHVDGRRLVHRASLGDLLAQLDPRRFIRVHRSAIINVDSLVRLEPAGHGEFTAVLRHGHSVRVSRTFKPGLEARFGQTL